MSETTAGELPNYSATAKLRQAIWQHEQAMQFYHAGDKPYEHVQAWRDAVVSAAMDMASAAEARGAQRERERCLEIVRQL